VHFKTDASKVNFAMTFLTKSALQWFDMAGLSASSANLRRMMVCMKLGPLAGWSL
jgi:hypothetical protein